MAKINKELDMGGGIIIKVAIDEGKAVMTTNYGDEIRKLFFKMKQQPGKDLVYLNRNGVGMIIERFKESAEEYSKNIDKDYLTGKEEQKKVMAKTKEDLKNGNNNSA